MCGIVYADDFGGKSVNNRVLDQFDKQRARGLDGFGVFDGAQIVRATKENKILRWLVRNERALLLMHHRYPTSTANTKKTAHPFTTRKYFGNTQYVLVHNGGIRNSDELFCDHQELGIEYQSMLPDLTYNDSEAFLWDFALTMENKQAELKARGAIAFICLKLVNNRLEKMYFGRNTLRPLNMERNKQGVFISSEGPGEPIDRDLLYTWNYKLRRLTKKYMKFDEPTIVYNPKPYVPPAYDNDYEWGTSSYSYQDGYWDKHGIWRRFKQPGEPGDWLGRELEKRLSTTIDGTGEIIPGAPPLGAPQIALPVGDIIERGNYDPITDDEVATEVGVYLAGVWGRFEQAYWALEADYLKATEKAVSPLTIRHRVLLEKALAFITNDPEYINDESVSSMWEALCRVR